MRVPTTAAFDQWLMDQQPWYPYSALQATRNSIFCKWVILTGRGDIGFREYFPVLSNSFSNGVLLAMIRSGEAVPLPLALSQVMDGIYNWGNVDRHWTHLIVNRLVLLANGGPEEDKRELVKHMINLRVHEIIQDSFGDTLFFDLIYVDWIQWFNITYSKEHFDGIFCFRTIAESSFDYIEGTIADMYNSIHNVDEVSADVVNSA
jgi:hypothetical protein